jgi:antitoxin ParD1/3/4
MPDSLPPELQQFVDQELASGRYQSTAAVICAGLRLLHDLRLHELRQDIKAGLQQLDRGEGIDIQDEASLQDFFDDIRKRGRERLQESRSRITPSSVPK